MAAASASKAVTIAATAGYAVTAVAFVLGFFVFPTDRVAEKFAVTAFALVMFGIVLLLAGSAVWAITYVCGSRKS